MSRYSLPLKLTLVRHTLSPVAALQLRPIKGSTHLPSALNSILTLSLISMPATLAILGPPECTEGTLDPRWLQADMDASIAAGRAILSPDGHGLGDEDAHVLSERADNRNGGFQCPVACCRNRQPFASKPALVRHLKKEGKVKEDPSLKRVRRDVA